MASKADIRAELLAATKITPKSGETEEALGTRVARAIDEKMSEDDYGNLSAAAIAWYEKAAPVVAEDGEYALPASTVNGTESGAASPAAKGKKAAPAKKAAAPAKKAAAPAKKAAAPAKKAAPEKKVKAPKEEKEIRVSATSMAIEMVCKKPKMTLEELTEKVSGEGVEVGAQQLAGVYRIAQKTISTLTTLGKL